MSGRRTEQHQCYMDFAPLLLYLVAMILRQTKCNSLFTSETVKEVERLLKLPKMNSDCTLYTPSVSDYTQNCSKSTLDCFIKETNVLSEEIKEKSKLVRMLSNLKRRMKNQSPPCPVCEVYKEENAVTFLKTLAQLLKNMNSE